MTERLLQFIWQFQYFNKQQLETVAGEKLEIGFAGEWNQNQGPDFKQARIKIGETQWAGEVEIHLMASDWKKHHHSKDVSYNKIILHVVWENDLPVIDENGLAVPTLELYNRVSNLLLGRYEAWMQVLQPIACNADIASVPALTWASWKARLVWKDWKKRPRIFFSCYQKQTIIGKMFCGNCYVGTLGHPSIASLSNSWPLRFL